MQDGNGGRTSRGEGIRSADDRLPRSLPRCTYAILRNTALNRP